MARKKERGGGPLYQANMDIIKGNLEISAPSWSRIGNVDQYGSKFYVKSFEFKSTELLQDVTSVCDFMDMLARWRT